MQTELEQIKAEYAKLGERIAELEKQAENEKGYSLEECFWYQKFGFYINSQSDIIKETWNKTSYKHYKNIATTEKVCKSHLAACQLSHIIERLNEDFGGTDNITISVNENENEDLYLDWDDTSYWAMPYLSSIKAANKLIETNTPLLKQYFGVE